MIFPNLGPLCLCSGANLAVSFRECTCNAWGRSSVTTNKYMSLILWFPNNQLEGTIMPHSTCKSRLLETSPVFLWGVKGFVQGLLDYTCTPWLTQTRSFSPTINQPTTSCWMGIFSQGSPIMTPTQTMHYKGNLWKFTHRLICIIRNDSPQMGLL